jgi:hypothetical protein
MTPSTSSLLHQRTKHRLSEKIHSLHARRRGANSGRRHPELVEGRCVVPCDHPSTPRPSSRRRAERSRSTTASLSSQRLKTRSAARKSGAHPFSWSPFDKLRATARFARRRDWLRAGLDRSPFDELRVTSIDKLRMTGISARSRGGVT